MHGIPALELWEVILQRTPALTLFEDNQATARIIQIGKFPKLRHVQRTHGICVAWLCDSLRKNLFSVADVHTKRQAADIFTKYFVNKDTWSLVTQPIGIISQALSKRVLKA